jgi:hypothetical protein
VIYGLVVCKPLQAPAEDLDVVLRRYERDHELPESGRVKRYECLGTFPALAMATWYRENGWAVTVLTPTEVSHAHDT